MVDTCTGYYTYQKNTPTKDKSACDYVCDAIIEYIESDKTNKWKLHTEIDRENYTKHNKPVEVELVYVIHDDAQRPIEDLALSILTDYELYLSDEASCFGKSAYFIGEPYDPEDLWYFATEQMREERV